MAKVKAYLEARVEQLCTCDAGSCLNISEHHDGCDAIGFMRVNVPGDNDVHKRTNQVLIKG